MSVPHTKLMTSEILENRVVKLTFFLHVWYFYSGLPSFFEAWNLQIFGWIIILKVKKKISVIILTEESSRLFSHWGIANFCSWRTCWWTVKFRTKESSNKVIDTGNFLFLSKTVLPKGLRQHSQSLRSL